MEVEVVSESKEQDAEAQRIGLWALHGVYAIKRSYHWTVPYLIA